MIETNQRPILEIGYYHPTATFAAIPEHISVMNTRQSISGSDGELIALFGPSECAGATAEEAAESRRQAQLFIAAPELLAALSEMLATVQASAEDECYGLNEGLHAQRQQAALDQARRALAKATDNAGETR